jgi:hypothetical protein
MQAAGTGAIIGCSLVSPQSFHDSLMFHCLGGGGIPGGGPIPGGRMLGGGIPARRLPARRVSSRGLM